jgi:uncharacterized integral membrane protein
VAAAAAAAIIIIIIIIIIMINIQKIKRVLKFGDAQQCVDSMLEIWACY